MYYSSDKPGGQGKFDIWSARLNADGTPGTSGNLGSVINSKEDDQAPYYYKPAGLLIFSSNGRIGMGGFDFYQSKKNMVTWAPPVNLGYPINSVKDDIYLLSTAGKYFTDNLLFSSDRSSECCLEMFALSKTRLKKNIAGTVVDCDSRTPVANAKITAVDPATGKELFSKTTNLRGQYEMSLDEYLALQVNAEADGYLAKSINITVPTDIEKDSLLNPVLCLTKPVAAKPFEENKAVVLNNVYYDYNKATLKPGSFIMLDSLAAWFNQYPNMLIEISGHTDDHGNDEFNMRLSQLRAQACVDYLVNKRGIDPANLQAKGYGESQPIAPNKKANGKDDPVGRQKNRRTEFKVLHY